MISFSFSSGTANVNQADGYLSEPTYFSFSGGNLTGDLVAHNPNTTAAFIIANLPGFLVTYDRAVFTSNPNHNGNYNINSPGTFTEVSAVPLPAAFPLFGAALAGLTGLGIRTSRRAAA